MPNILLAHVLGKKRIELYLEFDRALDESELAPLRDLVRRRGEGEPLQHLLGTVEFCGHDFPVRQTRAGSAAGDGELVEMLMCGMSEVGSQISSILDVGTGSGVIALSLAANFPEAQMSCGRCFGRRAGIWRAKMRRDLD